MAVQAKGCLLPYDKRFVHPRLAGTSWRCGRPNVGVGVPHQPSPNQDGSPSVSLFNPTPFDLGMEGARQRYILNPTQLSM